MKVLVLSPHTDDGELGAGGTVVKLLEQGHEIEWLVFCDASPSLPPDHPPDTLDREFEEVRATLRGIGGASCSLARYPVRRLHEHRQDVLEMLVGYRKNWDPDLVIGPSAHDVHQDHAVVHQEMVRAFKSCASIVCYEQPWNQLRSETQMIVELNEDQAATKIALARCYVSQHARPYMSEEYLRAAMRMRGAQIGVEYAEAFEVIRWIA